jgi:cobalamin biosynthesis protein CobT
VAATSTERKMLGHMTKLAAAMSRNWGVNVVFAGATPRTNGKTIFLPSNSDSFEGDSVRLLHSHLDHEVCHVTEEQAAVDSSRTRPLVIFNRVASDRRLRGLLNVYEDIRIERKYARRFPGVAENLDYGNRLIFRSILAQFSGGRLYRGNFWTLLGACILGEARGCSDLVPTEMKPWMLYLHAEISTASDWYSDKFSGAGDAFGEDVWAEDALALARMTLKKVEDALDAAERAAAERGKSDDKDDEGDESPSLPVPSKDKPKAEPKKDEGDGEDSDESGDESSGENESEAEGDDGSEGEGGESDGDDGESDGDDGESDGDDGDESEETGDGGDGESDGLGAAGSEGGVEANGTPVDDDSSDASSEDDGAEVPAVPSGVTTSREDAAADLHDLIKESIEKSSRDTTGDYVVSATSKAGDRFVADIESDPFYKVRARGENGLEDYQASLGIVKEQVGVLRRKLTNKIKIAQANRVVGDREVGDLDAASLHGLRFGEKRVFADVKGGENLDLAVSILVDLSGSMGIGTLPGSAAYYAKMACIALAETFDGLGIPFEIIGFHNNGARGLGPSMPLAGSEGAVRTPFDFLVFKGYSERLRSCRSRFVYMTGYYDNADGEAVWEVALRLAARPEARKLYFVISDGEPMCRGLDPSALNGHLRSVVKRITAAGIDVLGIGADTNAVEKFYNARTGAQNVVVRDLNTLALDIYKEMAKRINPTRSNRSGRLS